MNVSSDNSIPLLQEDCARSMDRLQRMLDGELPVSASDVDPHAASCRECRERIAAARVLLGELASRVYLILPAQLTESIVATVWEDRSSRIRRRTLTVVGASIIAVAASILFVIWLDRPGVPLGNAMAVGNGEEVASALPLAPEPRPARLSEELARVEQAVVESSRPIAEHVANASGILELFKGPLTLPVGPSPGFAPTRDALAELPNAARTGFEPVTSTTQKAVARLIREVGSVHMSTNPRQ